MRNTFKDPDLQAEFDLNGYVKVDLLAPHEVEVLKSLYEDKLGKMGSPSFAITSMYPDINARLEISDKIKSTFAKAVDKYMDDYQWYFGNYLIKYKSENPQEGYVTMHQDPSHLDEKRFRSVTIWCPLCDAGKDNGGMYMVKGSHRLNNHPRGYGRYGAIHFLYPELQKHLMDNYLVFEPLKAGQALIFPATTFHFSEPNRTDQPRITACGLLGPKEANLQYYHQESPDLIDVYNVDPAHYLTSPLFSRPDESKYEKVDEVVPGSDPLDQATLDTILSPLYEVAL
ncbi:MAG: phytanoyl-CoA dioxygenase family protein [Bacteroidota bacterium]